MSKVEEYGGRLRGLETPEWDSFLLAESGLPGPRGNLELAQAAAGGNRRSARPLARSEQEYLVFCGVLGLRAPDELRPWAGDRRWRVREAVAMALQRLGDADLPRLIAEMERWAAGDPYEQRAAAAALCEPRLLRDETAVERTLRVLDRITASFAASTERRSDAARTLRKGLGYCWSVAIAACPERGKRAFERWLDSADPDIRWILRENLRKRRLVRMDSEWVGTASARLARA